MSHDSHITLTNHMHCTPELGCFMLALSATIHSSTVYGSVGYTVKRGFTPTDTRPIYHPSAPASGEIGPMRPIARLPALLPEAGAGNHSAMQGSGRFSRSYEIGLRAAWTIRSPGPLVASTPVGRCWSTRLDGEGQSDPSSFRRSRECKTRMQNDIEKPPKARRCKR